MEILESFPIQILREINLVTPQFAIANLKISILCSVQQFSPIPLFFYFSGDWFILYQMSKNLNQRFFAEFITVLALTVNPDPNIEPEEPEIYLTEEDLERRRNGPASRASSESSDSSENSGGGSGDGEEGTTVHYAPETFKM